MPRPRSIAASVLLGALLFAVAGAATGQGRSASTGTLRVTERYSHSGGMYIEGAIETLSVRRADALARSACGAARRCT